MTNFCCELYDKQKRIKIWNWTCSYRTSLLVLEKENFWDPNLIWTFARNLIKSWGQMYQHSRILQWRRQWIVRRGRWSNGSFRRKNHSFRRRIGTIPQWALEHEVCPILTNKKSKLVKKINKNTTLFIKVLRQIFLKFQSYNLVWAC